MQIIIQHFKKSEIKSVAISTTTNTVKLFKIPVLCVRIMKPIDRF